VKGELEFVVSFRSPYAWIASRRVLPMGHPPWLRRACSLSPGAPADQNGHHQWWLSSSS
jgi:hypothetical protein